eukprot:gb/GECG01009200.1/.p1 GENE.gb/GECG01009200.1/~~gb/GECG01009200.1/.p1  ORF type:complete len:417 (+),score=30.89 gb/GECG01009200.1/:1-1251(+)
MPKVQLQSGNKAPFTYHYNEQPSEEGQQPNYIYVDLAIINHQTSGTMFDGQNPPCEFLETSQTPIIENPSEYKLAVRKFSLDGVTANLPIFHFFTTQNSPTEGVYKVTVRSEKNSTVTRTVNVPFQSQRNDLSQPIASRTGDHFYRCYSIDFVVQMFNDAIKTAFDDTYQNTSSPQISQEEYPFLYYEPDTNRIVCYAPTNGWGDINQQQGTERWRLYFDQNTYNVFSNLPFEYVEDSNLVGGEGQYEISFTSKRGRHIIDIDPQKGTTQGGTSAPYYVMDQEYPALGRYWSPVESVAVVSQNLNIVPVLQTAPIEYSKSRYGNLGQTAKDHAQDIISEFTIDKSNPCAWQENLVFVASEYTFLSIQSADDKALRQIRAQFFYRDRFTSELIPLDLPNQSTAHLSLVFQHKDIEER